MELMGKTEVKSPTEAQGLPEDSLALPCFMRINLGFISPSKISPDSLTRGSWSQKKQKRSCSTMPIVSRSSAAVQSGSA